jgi:hypothetical protein
MRFVYGRDPARRPRPSCQPRPSRCRGRARRRRSCGVRRTASRQRSAPKRASAYWPPRRCCSTPRASRAWGSSGSSRRARSRSQRSTGTSQGRSTWSSPTCTVRTTILPRAPRSRQKRCRGATLSALSVTTSPPGSSRPPSAAAPSSTPSRSSTTRRALSAWSSPSTASGVYQFVRRAFEDAGHQLRANAARHFVTLRDGAMSAAYLDTPTIAIRTFARGVDRLIRTIDTSPRTNKRANTRLTARARTRGARDTPHLVSPQ